MTYPDDPGHTKGIDTSREAANAIYQSAAAQETEAFKCLAIAGSHGLTLDEVFSQVKGLFPGLVKNNLSARLGRLCAKGKVVRTSRKRTADGGRPQSVYYTKVCAPEGENSTPAPRQAHSLVISGKPGTNLASAIDLTAPTIPNRLPIPPVRMDDAEIMDIENWVRETTQTPTGLFTQQREVAAHVRKLLRIYKSYIA